MSNLPDKLLQKLEERKTIHSLRSLSTTDIKIDLSSNDYLGMATEESLFIEASQLLKEKKILKNGATGSRLLSGNHLMFQQTEQLIARHYESESALIFNSGYDANLGFFSSVPQRNDVVFYDEYVHASIRDGIKMGVAKALKFKHNDLIDLKQAIQRFKKNSAHKAVCYVVTETVFSMDGDSPEIQELIELCLKEECRLILDEAHFIKGLDDSFNSSDYGKQVFARIITFGKAMGIQGAAILGCGELKNYLINFSRSFIYTTALPPIAIASIYTGINKLIKPEFKARINTLKANISFFNQELLNTKLDKVFIPSIAAIHSCIIPGNTRVKMIAELLQEKGFDVKPILSPTVPVGQERLRFCLHSFNTTVEIKQVLSILAEVIDKESNGR